MSHPTATAPNNESAQWADKIMEVKEWICETPKGYFDISFLHVHGERGTGKTTYFPVPVAQGLPVSLEDRTLVVHCVSERESPAIKSWRRELSYNLEMLRTLTYEEARVLVDRELRGERE